MRNLSAILFCLFVAFIITLGYFADKESSINNQVKYDSLEVAIKAHNAILDTLANKEAVIIQNKYQTTKRYYENHYTILAANDSATRESLLSNIARFEHLHFDTPSKNH